MRSVFVDYLDNRAAYYRGERRWHHCPFGDAVTPRMMTRVDAHFTALPGNFSTRNERDNRSSCGYVGLTLGADRTWHLDRE